MKRYLLLSFLLTLSYSNKISAQNQNSTWGTEFWVAYMENISLMFNGPPTFTLQLYSDHNTTVDISTPADKMHITVNLIAGKPVEDTLPAGIYYTQGPESYGNDGIKIVSKDPIQVVAMHYRFFFSEASVILPVNLLSSHYMVSAYHDDHFTSPSEAVITSAVDNNNITITPSVFFNGNRKPGIPYTIELDAGYTYQLQSNDDMSGTIIDGTGKFAVFGGARQAYCDCPGHYADNHLWDQTLPVNLWGTEYLAVPFAYEKGSPIHIIASEDNTKVYENCKQIASLMKGGYYDTVINSAAIITGNKPVCVSQLLKSGDCAGDDLGDPSFVNILPLNTYDTVAGFNVYDSFKNYRVYANLIIPVDAISDLTLDGKNYVLDSFNILPNNSKYAYSTIAFGMGYHTLKCSKGFNAVIYAKLSYDAFTYTLGYQGIRPDNTILVDSNNVCAGKPLKFSFIPSDSLNNFKWNFGDNDSSTKRTTTHVYSQPGQYIANASGYTSGGCLETFSEAITVIDCGKTTCTNCSTPDLCNVSIYPNPGHSINIRADQVQSISLIEVTDALGKVIYSLDGSNLSSKGSTIDLSQLRSAIYFVTVVCNGGRSTSKICVIN